MSKPQSQKFIFCIYLLLAAGTIAVFWHVRNFDFTNYDDNLYVSENQHVLNGLTYDGIIWAFTTGYACFWHPITWLSLMLNCQLFGPDPGWFHLVNVFLHLANILLLFTILKKITGSLWPSAFVAAAFALHPMHVESVAWISERKDVLSALFWMLTLLSYVSYVKRPAAIRYLVTITIFVIGLMAKPMLVTLPFILLLLDYWPLNRFDFQPAKTSDRQSRKLTSIPDRRRILYQMIIEKIPFLILAVVFSIIAFLTQQASGSIVDTKAIFLTNRVGNAFLSYATYIGKMFWPQNLAAHYPFNAVGSVTLWQFMLCALLLLVISIFVIRFGRTKKYLLVGWFWFVGTLIPVIGLVQFTGSSHADRFTYIPYIGLFIMIAWGLPELLSKWPYRKFTPGISAFAVLTILGICAHRQVSYWNNGTSLFTHAIKVTQDNYFAHCSLGISYKNLGRYQNAIEAYKQAIRIKPDFVEAYNNLGNAYTSLGRYQDAVEAYKQAIRIKPDWAEAHYNLGNAYINLSRYQDAIEAFKQAIGIKPNLAEAYYNLGAVYLTTGDKASAIEEYKILKTLDVELANKLFNLINK